MSQSIEIQFFFPSPLRGLLLNVNPLRQKQSFMFHLVVFSKASLMALDKNLAFGGLKNLFVAQLSPPPPGYNLAVPAKKLALCHVASSFRLQPLYFFPFLRLNILLFQSLEEWSDCELLLLIYVYVKYFKLQKSNCFLSLKD